MNTVATATSLIQIVCTLVLEKIPSSFTTTAFGIHTQNWSPDSRKLLKFLIDGEYIRNDQLIQKIHESLIHAGRRNFNLYISGNLEPDHLPSPTALAYALKHAAFSGKEREQIRFGHGETEYSFITENVSENICEVILEKLLGVECSHSKDEDSFLGTIPRPQ